MTLADRALGMAAWQANERKPQATVQLDVHFVEAVRIGELVQAQCKVVGRTKSLTFMSATVLAGERIVLTASGVWKTVRT